MSLVPRVLDRPRLRRGGGGVVSRSQKMLHALQDGRWHSRREIQERVGYFLTNNAASELRSKGYAVEQRRVKGNYEYRLSEGRALSSSNERDGNPSHPTLSPARPSLSRLRAIPADSAPAQASGGGQLLLLDPWSRKV